VRDVLSEKSGEILVQGHTDNIAISTSRFRSNWELSTARAVSVAHELLTERVLNPQRLTVSGYSDTRPLVKNDSKENRAFNRRVEIVVSQGLDTDLRTELNNLKEGNPLLYQDLDVKLTPRFDIRPDEIF
jgi:chemotaxis protein MotB